MATASRARRWRRCGELSVGCAYLPVMTTTGRGGGSVGADPEHAVGRGERLLGRVAAGSDPGGDGDALRQHVLGQRDDDR